MTKAKFSRTDGLPYFFQWCSALAPLARGPPLKSLEVKGPQTDFSRVAKEVKCHLR